MPASTIYVQYSDGSSAEGVKVEMSINGASCRGEFVDKSGKAVISHSTSGEAKVYIHGSLRGEFRAPGSISVNVK